MRMMAVNEAYLLFFGSRNPLYDSMSSQFEALRPMKARTYAWRCGEYGLAREEGKSMVMWSKRVST